MLPTAKPYLVIVEYADLMPIKGVVRKGDVCKAWSTVVTKGRGRGCGAAVSERLAEHGEVSGEEQGIHIWHHPCRWPT